MMRIACVVALLVACDKGQGTKPAPASEEATISDAERACQTDADCTLVDPTCRNCCTQKPVSTRSMQAVLARKKEVCEHYRGGQCDCAAQVVHAACKSGLCEVVEGN